MSNELYQDSSLDNRQLNELKTAFELAEHTVYKNYLEELQYYPVVEISQLIMDQKPEDCIRMFKLNKLSCKKGEDILQKLSTVYNAGAELGGSIFVIIDVKGNNAPVDVYIGVKCESDINDLSKLSTSFQTLKNGLKSNFPGTAVSDCFETDKLLDDIFGNYANFISSVSCVASIRDKSKTENKDFIQGIEKFIDSMSGNAYTALFIAEPISQSEQKLIREGYENLYSNIVPFKKSVWSYNENESSSVTQSITDGISNAIIDGTSKTRSHTFNAGVGIGKGSSQGISSAHGKMTKASKSLMIGGAALSIIGNFIPGIGIIGNAAMQASNALSGSESVFNSISKNLGVNLGYAYGRSYTQSTSNVKTQSSSNTHSTTSQNGKGKTLQIENINKSVEEMLNRIDEQLKRTRECEDYGSYSCAAYFIASKESVSLLAANTYRALMMGEGSSVESGAINNWGDDKSDKEKLKNIKEYLKHFTHPVFVLPLNNKENSGIPYTPGTIVSGLELPLHLGLPTKSVHGLPVIECAEFGRNIVTYNIILKNKKMLDLGNIFHMYNEEKQNKVSLHMDSLASHVFITGSTGSGKSNTVYKMLSEAQKLGVPFLVIEPAKGEYKDVFSGIDGLSVFGTNPKKTPLLRINPFSFCDDVHILEHIDRLIEIFNVCWPMYAAMPAVLKSAVERSYIDCGWDLMSSANKYDDNLYPSFSDVARNIKYIIDSSEYDNENKGAYKGSLLTRLQSLTTGINGIIFSADELSGEELFNNNVIIDLSRVGASETKSLIMGMLVLKLQEYRISKCNTMNSELRHITVLEEAHNILKRTSMEQSTESSNITGKSVEMIANAIAEMRTYGEGFIIADQAPGLMDMSVIRNTNTKIIMRLPDRGDRELVGKAANLNDDQIDELAKLPCGVATVYQNEWVQPVLCKVARFDTPDTSYEYQCEKEIKSDTKSDDMVKIAELLSNGTKLSREAILTDIIPTLKENGIKASVQVAVANQLENPPREPRMTKLAPIMSALFPKVKTAVISAYNDNPDASEWTNRAEEALLNNLMNGISDRTRRDIIQAIVTDYVYVELGNQADIQKWAENGGLR